MPIFSFLCKYLKEENIVGTQNILDSLYIIEVCTGYFIF